MREILYSPVRLYDNHMLGLSVGSITWRRYLQTSILYWPSTIVPLLFDDHCENRFHIFDEAELKYLKDTGSLRTVDFHSISMDFNSDLLYLTRSFLSQYASAGMCIGFNGEKEEGDRSDFIKNFFGDSNLPTDIRVGVKVTLLNSLPVAPPNVAWQDIVDYKCKRADELEELHIYFDKLSAMYVGAGDIQDATRLAAHEIAPILERIDATMTERWGRVIRHSLTTGLGVFSRNALIGAAVGTVFGEPIPGAIAGGVTAAVETVVTNGWNSPELKKDGPLAYAFHRNRI